MKNENIKKSFIPAAVLATIITLALTLLFTVTGCSTDNRSSNFLRVGDEVNVFLNAGEMAELDFAELFKDYELNIKKVKMVSSNKKVFTVSGNKIKAVGMGIERAKATVTDKDTGKQTVIIVRVYVVNPSKMKEVKSARDLAEINTDMYGMYILKSDIDLEGFGDWIPIGFYSNDFRGILINPDGYKIKNLTIKSSATYAGLFGSMAGAYIDGLILENVSIDTTADLDDKMYAGGICGMATGCVIRNCIVDGLIFAQETAGGIVGMSSRGLIIGNAFKGVVESTSSAKFAYGSGGIVGGCIGSTRIIDCIAEAAINAKLYAGGIVGFYGDLPSFYDNIEDYIENCSFTGELNAPQTGELYGWFGGQGVWSE